MARFVTIGYGDEEGCRRTDPAVRDAAHAHDAWLTSRGVEGGVAGAPVQVRDHDGAGVVRTDGPFMQAALPVAGFAVIEAADLDGAVALAAKSPCAVAQGVIEVWPLQGA